MGTRGIGAARPQREVQFGHRPLRMISAAVLAHARLDSLTSNAPIMPQARHPRLHVHQ